MTDNEHVSQELPEDRDPPMEIGIDTIEAEKGDGAGLDEPEEAATEMEEDGARIEEPEEATTETEEDGARIEEPEEAATDTEEDGARLEESEEAATETEEDGAWIKEPEEAATEMEGDGAGLDEPEEAVTEMEGDGAGTEEPEEAATETEEEEYEVELSDIGELIGEATRLLEEVSALRGSITDIQIGGKNLTPNLSEYRGRMRTWKTKGYKVEGLESVLGTGNEELAKRVFQSFERDVKRLKEIEKSLDGLDTTGFKKKESDIRENLKDPERIIPTLKYLIELEIDIRRKMEMDV